MKTCNKCKVEKELTAFAKDAKLKSGYRGQCKECVSTYSKTIPSKPRDRKEYAKDYYQKNKEKIIARSTEFNRQNREKTLEYKKRYHKKYYEKNRERILARNAEYAKLNPEVHAAKDVRRRRQKEVNMDQIDRALSADYRRAIRNDPCYYCGELKAIMHIDHYFPLALGGTDHWWNLVRACASCNLSKGKTPGGAFNSI